MKMKYLKIAVLSYGLLIVLSAKSQTSDDRMIENLNSAWAKIMGEQLSAQDVVDKAAQGNVDAMFELGICYRRGNRGVQADQSQAAFWLKKAADKGHAQAQYYIASYYLNGEGGLQIDTLKAYKYYTMSAEQDDEYAMAELSGLWAVHGISDSAEKALMWNIKCADFFKEKGDQSMASIYEYEAFLKYEGYTGVPKDGDLALHYLKRSISHDFNDVFGMAYNSIGELYLEGRRMPKDEKMAIEYFEKAHKRGCGLGTGNLGEIYYKRGDYDKAFPLLKEASENIFFPSPKAMRLLSYCYKYGRGTDVNMAEWEKWIGEAAAHKDLNAMELMKLNN